MSISPCVARFRRPGERWFAFAGQAGIAPIDTVQLVIEAPEFLGILSPGTPQPRAAMVAPGAQSGRVLVVVDEAGGVQLAACPEPGSGLAAVVGDVLAANGKLWHQKYQALAGPFEESLGMALTDWVAARAGEGWSADGFRAGFEQSLNGGKFPITVVVEGLDDAGRESLEYLQHMNLQVRVIGYSSSVSGEDELVRPKLLVGEPAAPPAQPAGPPRQDQPPKVAAAEPRAEAKAGVPQADSPIRSLKPGFLSGSAPAPQAKATGDRGPLPRQGQSPRPEPVKPRAEATSGAPQADNPIRSLKPGFLSGAAPAPQAGANSDYGPLPVSNATPKQKEILNRLIKLDELGLPRRGFAYFLPDVPEQGTVEGTIVISVDPDRWPFPKAGEVIVVVNPGTEHLAAYLKIAPREIEEFLGSLPRADRKGNKGALLLRAATVNEAVQLTNELKALKEVTIGG